MHQRAFRGRQPGEHQLPIGKGARVNALAPNFSQPERAGAAFWEVVGEGEERIAGFLGSRWVPGSSAVAAKAQWVGMPMLPARLSSDESVGALVQWEPAECPAQLISNAPSRMTCGREAQNPGHHTRRPAGTAATGRCSRRRVLRLAPVLLKR